MEGRSYGDEAIPFSRGTWPGVFAKAADGTLHDPYTAIVKRLLVLGGLDKAHEEAELCGL